MNVTDWKRGFAEITVLFSYHSYSTEKGPEQFECRTLKTQKTLLLPQNFHSDQSHGIDFYHLIYHTLLKD